MGQVHRKYVVAKPMSIPGQQLAPQPVISRYVIFYEGRGKNVRRWNKKTWTSTKTVHVGSAWCSQCPLPVSNRNLNLLFLELVIY